MTTVNIESTVSMLVSLNLEGFKRSGVVFFDYKTSVLRGQKGVVDAGESPKAATAAQYWMRLPH